MIDGLLAPFRHWFHYDPRRYWNERFQRDGTIRAAGNYRRPPTANALEYMDDWRVVWPILPPSGTILEIGPGTGWYTHQLSRHYSELTSLEVSDVATERLRRRGYDVIRGNICHFKPARRWDLVLMIEVVQHIVTRQSFREAMRNLREIVGKQLIIGALTDGKARRTAFHVHQWTAGDIESETGMPGTRLCDFRTGGLWKFTREDR